MGKWDLGKKRTKKDDSKQSPKEGSSGSVLHGNSGDTLQVPLTGSKRAGGRYPPDWAVLC